MISGSISNDVINDIIGLIYIFEAKSELLHYIFVLNLPVILKLLFTYKNYVT